MGEFIGKTCLLVFLAGFILVSFFEYRNNSSGVHYSLLAMQISAIICVLAILGDYILDRLEKRIEASINGKVDKLSAEYIVKSFAETQVALEQQNQLLQKQVEEIEALKSEAKDLVSVAKEWTEKKKESTKI